MNERITRNQAGRAIICGAKSCFTDADAKLRQMAEDFLDMAKSLDADIENDTEWDTRSRGYQATAKARIETLMHMADMMEA